MAGSNAIAALERAIGLAGGDNGTHDRGPSAEADAARVDDSAELADATVALDIRRLAATARTTHRRRVVRVFERPIANNTPARPVRFGLASTFW
jgi:hypothetical protein